MRKIILLTVCILLIVIITFTTFNKENIIYWFTHTFKESNYQTLVKNEYYLEDNFNFVDNYTSNKIESKQELTDFIYYFINSGADEVNAYCSLEYKECINDIDTLSSDIETLSILNNFVHPYNSFVSLEFNYDTYGNFTIKSNKLYSEEEIILINSLVDTIINNYITSDMSDEEKIETIHNYIINNTEYDSLKTNDIKDDTYKSESAYGVLLEGFGICSGYSDAMAIFLTRMGYINYKISNDDHIWNLVKLNDKWLHIDLTWDDPITEVDVLRSDYLLIDETTLQSLDDSHDYNYYIFSEGLEN